MTRDKAAKPGPPPRTLVEAHAAVAHIRPDREAPLEEWRAYYRRSAALYAEIAEIDRGHHHEALCMAEQAQNSAREIEAQIPGGEGREGDR